MWEKFVKELEHADKVEINGKEFDAKKLLKAFDEYVEWVVELQEQ
jgi:hypothetical protein